MIDARLGAGIAEAEKRLGLEEKLSQRLAGPRVQLALQPVDVGLGVCRLGVHVRVGADTDGEIARVRQSRHQIHRVRKSVGMRRKPIRTLRRIPPQGHDVGDTRRGKSPRDLERLIAGRLDAGQMRRRTQARMLDQRGHHIAREFPGCAPRTVGHRDKPRLQRCQNLNGVPKPEGAFNVLGRKKLETDVGAVHGTLLDRTEVLVARAAL